MSTRAALIYILIGALLAGYVGVHWAMARELDITVERKWSGATKRRFGTGTAYFVDTDQGTLGFMGTPFTADSDEMFAQLPQGGTAKVKVISWLHGPLLEGMLDSVARPMIVAVLP